MAAKRSPSTAGSAPVASDAYVGLLLISLLAQIAGVVFFYLDLSQYPDKKPPSVPSLPAASAPAPAAPPGAPGVPPAGGMAGVAPGAGMAGAPPAGGMAGMAGAVK